jgi:hypothetical protein
MVERGRLDRVVPSPSHARRLLKDAADHIAGADAIISQDPNGSYQLAYDAGRKSASAILAAEGLRSTAKGGHVAVIESMRELDIATFDLLDRLRRRRNRLEYPDEDDAPATRDDVLEALAAATAMLDAARKYVGIR